MNESKKVSEGVQANVGIPCQAFCTLSNIQSLLSLVCEGPLALRVTATQITTIPTATTIIVAAMGTAIFKSTQSGIQGNSILTLGKSRIGAIVPRNKRENERVLIYLCDSFLCRATRKLR